MCNITEQKVPRGWQHACQRKRLPRDSDQPCSLYLSPNGKTFTTMNQVLDYNIQLEKEKEIRDKKKLEQKMLKMNDRPRLSCDECSERFVNSNMLKKHQKEYHSKSMKCQQCFATFPTTIEMKNHYDNHHANIKCSICYRNYPSEMKLDLHMKLSHTDFVHKTFKNKKSDEINHNLIEKVDTINTNQESHHSIEKPGTNKRIVTPNNYEDLQKKLAREEAKRALLKLKEVAVSSSMKTPALPPLSSMSLSKACMMSSLPMPGPPVPVSTWSPKTLPEHSPTVTKPPIRLPVPSTQPLRSSMKTPTPDQTSPKKPPSRSSMLTTTLQEDLASLPRRAPSNTKTDTILKNDKMTFESVFPSSKQNTSPSSLYRDCLAKPTQTSLLSTPSSQPSSRPIDTANVIRNTDMNLANNKIVTDQISNFPSPIASTSSLSNDCSVKPTETSLLTSPSLQPSSTLSSSRTTDTTNLIRKPAAGAASKLVSVSQICRYLELYDYPVPINEHNKAFFAVRENFEKFYLPQLASINPNSHILRLKTLARAKWSILMKSNGCERPKLTFAKKPKRNKIKLNFKV